MRLLIADFLCTSLQKQFLKKFSKEYETRSSSNYQYRNMHFELLLSYLIMECVEPVVANDMIIDYFDFKQMPSVVGLSCNVLHDDVKLLRNFNQRNIKASISKSNKHYRMNAFAKTDHTRLGIFLDIRCLETEMIKSIISETTDYRMYDELHQWLIIGNDLKDVLGVIDDAAFGLSTDFVIAVPAATNCYKLYDVYNRCKKLGGVLNVTFYGDWNYEKNLTVNLTQPKYNRRLNLHGLVLSAVFFKATYKMENESLEDYLEDYQRATKDARSRYGYHILKHLSELNNFTFKFSESLKWQPDDRLGSIVRSISSGEIDFTGTPLTMSISRTHSLRFVHQDWPFRTIIVFRNPQPTEIKVREMFRPLANNVWYLMILLMAMSFACLNFTLRFDSNWSNSMSVSDSFLLIVAAVCQQGTNMRARWFATRMVYFCTLLSSLLIYNYYSASVVKARLDDPIFKINDSLQDFANLKMKMTSEWIAYIEYLLNFNKETRQFRDGYWSRISESEKYIIPEEGIRLVRRGGFAYHMHPQVGYPLIDSTFDHREICELMEVHLATPQLTAFGITSKSTIIEMSRVGLTKITEVGLRMRHILRWQYKKPLCRKDILTASSVNIYEFLPHLIFLIIGIVFSVVICIVEIVFSNKI